MRLLAALAFAFLPLAAVAQTYRVQAGVEARGDSLKVEPSVTGPAGKLVRYEIEVRRGGDGNTSNSRQSGTARLDESGNAKLASTSVSLNPEQSYDVEVTLFEGSRIVARERASRP